MAQDTGSSPQTYYATPGPMTDPGKWGTLFDPLPPTIPEVVAVVQGLMVHIFWAERYGLQLAEERQAEVQIRDVATKLKRIVELDDRPLAEPRPLEKKLVGNCRDFTVLTCAMLQHHGLPTRARCGFGTYFLPDRYEDHWVCEYWNADQQRWVMVDAQLDDFQRQALGIEFDPLDMPPGQFVTGGQAWQMCRSGADDPEKFGIFDMHGLWFVRGDLIRDFLALNKVEILPWDGGWGFLAGEDDLVGNVMDRAAVLTLGGDALFGELRAAYEAEPRFHVPDDYLPAAYR
ncbi:MAG: transglutaminase domain-containing protein [Anaerolineae bacterium]|nr:transglutaminase domain-containing protein [Anaerolineae bacterium]